MRYFILILFMISQSFILFSQDTIVKINTEKILSKVLEITPDLIKYKNYNNLEGPDIYIQRHTVKKILYANGTQEIITEDNKDSQRYIHVDLSKSDSNSNNKSDEETYKPSTNFEVTKTFSEDKKEYENGVNQVLKFSPFLIVQGEIPLYFEKRIAKSLSTEISAGLTLLDYTDNVFSSYPEYYKTKMGYSCMVAFRYYTSDYVTGIDELYLSTEFRYRKYVIYVDEYYDYDVNPIVYVNRQLLDLQFKIGYMNFVSDLVVFDYYFGIGIRQRVKDNAQFNLDYNYSNTILNISTASEKAIIPSVTMGIRIGFGW